MSEEKDFLRFLLTTQPDQQRVSGSRRRRVKKNKTHTRSNEGRLERQMGKDRYHLHLSSKDSKDLHPQNKITDFVVELPEALDLTGAWEVGLFQADYHVQRKITQPYYVFCDLCEESFIYDHQLPILQKVSSGKGYFNSFPLYVHVKTSAVQRIHIYLTDSAMNTLPGESGKFECGLILRRVYK